MPGRLDIPMVLAVALATSTAALLLAWWTGSLSVRTMARAVGVALETVGAVAIFMAVNVALGVTLVLALRVLTRLYPTLYEMADVAVLILSVLQALTYQAWRLSRP
jgi:hypothetical protein